MSVFYQELQGHPQALKDTLDAYYKKPKSVLNDIRHFWKSGKYKRVLFTGMGSSLYASEVATVYLNEHGIPAVTRETGELLHYCKSDQFEDDTLLILTSQSGESIEITKLIERFHKNQPFISVTNCPNSTLAKSSTFAIFTYAGKETSTASKTYTATIAGLLLLAGSITNTLQDIRKPLYQMVKHESDFLKNWKKKLAKTKPFIKDMVFVDFIARGYCYGTALQCGLITKESTKTYAEGITGGTFRHGPIEVVNPGFRAVVFAPEGNTTKLMLGMAKDIAALNGKVLLITNTRSIPKNKNILSVPLPSCPEFVFPLLDILVVELLCCQIAERKHITAGQFERIQKITLTE